MDVSTAWEGETVRDYVDLLGLQNPCILAIDYSVKVQTHADLTRAQVLNGDNSFFYLSACQGDSTQFDRKH